MLELAIKLILVTAVMCAGLLLVSRGGRVVRGPDGMRVTARQGLAKGTVIAVVEVEDRRFLVGASDHQVTLLSELERAPEHAGPSHGTGPAPLSTGPRIGPMDRLRAMTVRSTLEPTGLERPIHVTRRTT